MKATIADYKTERILVIGNGFDLAHGLPTGYVHFLSFVNAVMSSIDFCAN